MKQAKPRPLDWVLLRLLLSRLFLPLLVLSLLTTGLMSYLVQRDLKARQQGLARTLAHRVDDYLDQASRVLDAVTRMAETSTPQEMARPMRATWQAYGHFDALYRLDKNGVVILLSPPDSRYLGLDMSRQSYFQLNREQTDVVISRPFASLRTGQPTVYMVRSLSNGGLMIGELNLGTLQEAITTWLDEPGHNVIFVADRSGVLLAHPRPELVAQQANVSHLEIVRRGLTADTTLLYSAEGDLMLSSATPLKRAGWVIVAQTPLFADYAPYLRVTGLILLLTLAIWLALTWGLRRQFKRHVVAPLARLSQEADALAAGDFTQGEALSTVPANFAELSALSADFFRMSQAIQARQKALQASEARYRAVVEDQTELISRSLPDRTLTFVNPAYCRYFGKSPEELVGHSFTPQVVEQDRARVDQQTAPLSPSAPVTTVENRVVSAGGELRWQQWTNRAIFDPEGHLVEYQAVGRDITERKLAEEALQRKTRHQEHLLTTAHSLTASLDVTVVLTRIAAGAREILEAHGCDIYLLEADNKTLTPVVAIDPPYEQEILSVPLNVDNSLTGQAIQARRGLVFNDTAGAPNYQIPGTPVEGDERIVVVPFIVGDAVLGAMTLSRTGTLFSEQDLALAEAFAVYAVTALKNAQTHRELEREVDKHRRTEEALRDAEAQYRLLVEQIPAVVYKDTVDDLSSAIYMSPQVDAMLGYSLDEWIADRQLWIKLLHPEDRQRVLAENARVNATGDPFRLEYRLVARDGHTVWVRDEAMIVRDGAGRPQFWQGIWLDITERKQTEARLAQAEKMAALGRLIAFMAHNINNPLQAIQGSTELAAEELDGNARQDKLARYLNVIGQETERVATIVRRVRDLYAPAEKLQLTDLRAVLESSLELTAEQLHSCRVVVERDWAADVPAIPANPDHLRQVFIDFVINATASMRARGGILRVRASLDHIPGRDKPSRPAARIEFSDTGDGIPPEKLPHVFDPFFTVDQKGMGMGLSISLGLVELYGGQVTVTSQVGVGTTFAILLPVGPQ